MNILAHLAALVALGWLIQLLFVTMNEPILGFAVLVVFVLFIPLSWVAIKEDQEILK